MAVIHRGTVVGHVPRKISAACSLFLGRKESIDAPSVAVVMCAHALVHVHHALRDSWILLANLKFGRRHFNC